MSWNYRKMYKKIKEGSFEGEWQCGIVEVYYDDEGNIQGYTDYIVDGGSAETKELAEKEFHDTMKLMSRAFMKETLIEDNIISEEK